MLTVRKRGRVFHADLLNGDKRIRGSLGTRNQDAALRIAHKLEIALSEGATSSMWPELNRLIPKVTYGRFADVVGAKDRQIPTWNELVESFKLHMEQRIDIGKFRRSTERRYSASLKDFDQFLSESQINLLYQISKPVIESFKVWRVRRIKRQKFARGATSIALDLAVLHRIFAIALENEMVSRNPVRMEGKPAENPEHGAEPFTETELAQLQECAGVDLLIYLVLRWTGLRGSDAVSLTWKEIDFDQKEIVRVTQKRQKKVFLPIQSELMFALESIREIRKPKLSERVLLNPRTGNILTRPRLYQRMLALGKRAGVANAHPHRFRDSLAVYMLSQGANPYDVAKMLGDTIETVERHYTPFVPVLRERVRSILEKEACPVPSVTPASQYCWPN